ncbi:uncharacterized protein V1518DRAFT_426113 [Limtongia smithiae]|uniref:uncharacterized protein n=1 Tax=Limtongia smithiae TaxID=1125753 RepID=UPI0034CE55C7
MKTVVAVLAVVCVSLVLLHTSPEHGADLATTDDSWTSSRHWNLHGEHGSSSSHQHLHDAVHNQASRDGAEHAAGYNAIENEQGKRELHGRKYEERLARWTVYLAHIGTRVHELLGGSTTTHSVQQDDNTSGSSATTSNGGIEEKCMHQDNEIASDADIRMLLAGHTRRRVRLLYERRAVNGTMSTSSSTASSTSTTSTTTTNTGSATTYTTTYMSSGSVLSTVTYTEVVYEHTSASKVYTSTSTKVSPQLQTTYATAAAAALRGVGSGSSVIMALLAGAFML